MSEGMLAVVTGASSGIGLELARLAAEEGCDLVICADEPAIETAAEELRGRSARVEALQLDLSTEEGVRSLVETVGDRQVDYLIANAGRGLGHGFFEQDWTRIREVIETNIMGTTLLLRELGGEMHRRDRGRILILGSIAGEIPGSFQAVYNATKAYLDSLSWALRNELKDSQVTVTCLMPGPTETRFFERAGMEDTPVGQDDSKDDAAMVARQGFEAMKKGSSGVTTGFMNKVQSTFAGIIPDSVLAQMHRRMADPDRDEG